MNIRILSWQSKFIFFSIKCRLCSCVPLTFLSQMMIWTSPNPHHGEAFPPQEVACQTRGSAPISADPPSTFSNPCVNSNPTSRWMSIQTEFHPTFAMYDATVKLKVFPRSQHPLLRTMHTRPSYPRSNLKSETVLRLLELKQKLDESLTHIRGYISNLLPTMPDVEIPSQLRTLNVSNNPYDVPHSFQLSKGSKVFWQPSPPWKLIIHQYNGPQTMDHDLPVSTSWR